MVFKSRIIIRFYFTKVGVSKGTWIRIRIRLNSTLLPGGGYWYRYPHRRQVQHLEKNERSIGANQLSQRKKQRKEGKNKKRTKDRKNERKNERMIERTKEILRQTEKKTKKKEEKKKEREK